MPAEWEPHRACLMAWPNAGSDWPLPVEAIHSDFCTLVRAINRFEPVWLVVDPEDAPVARRALPELERFFETPLDDAWVRDSGPTFTVNPDGALSGVDFRFNGWGKFPHGRDAKLASILLSRLGIARVPSDLVCEGGALHVDGQGRCLLTESVLLNDNRNPGMVREDVERELSRTLGVHDFCWLPAGLEDDDTDGHIDELACFTAPGRLLALVSDDPSDANHAILAENYERLCAFARDADFPTPPVTVLQPPARYLDGVRLARSYINFYLPNGAVVMPGYAEPAHDRAARDVVARCFPEREVVQVDCSRLVSGGGNIHCLTQQIPVGKA